jgi:hypothetical protein
MKGYWQLKQPVSLQCCQHANPTQADWQWLLEVPRIDPPPKGTCYWWSHTCRWHSLVARLSETGSNWGNAPQGNNCGAFGSTGLSPLRIEPVTSELRRVSSFWPPTPPPAPLQPCPPQAVMFVHTKVDDFEKLVCLYRSYILHQWYFNCEVLEKINLIIPFAASTKCLV